MTWTRRRTLWGAGAAAGLAALAGLGWSTRGLLFGKHYPPTPYDDILAFLPDREPAARIGQEVLQSMPNLESSAAANVVRARLSHQNLREAVLEDAARGRLVEARGWVLPETLGLLSALAASV